MRLLRWVPLLVALIGIYLITSRAREFKEAVEQQAPARLGIQDRDWNHWSLVADQIRGGHLPDLNDKDWANLKKLYDSADRTVHDHAGDVIELLEKTPYKDKAQELLKSRSE